MKRYVTIDKKLQEAIASYRAECAKIQEQNEHGSQLWVEAEKFLKELEHLNDIINELSEISSTNHYMNPADRKCQNYSIYLVDTKVLESIISKFAPVSCFNFDEDDRCRRFINKEKHINIFEVITFNSPSSSKFLFDAISQELNARGILSHRVLTKKAWSEIQKEINLKYHFGDNAFFYVSIVKNF